MTGGRSQVFEPQPRGMNETPKTIAWRHRQLAKIPRNIAGRRFGALVVLEMTDRVNRLNQPIWALKCDCGKDFESTAWKLRAGIRTHCGCGRGEPPSKKLVKKDVGGLTGDRWQRILRAAEGKRQKVALTQQQAWNIFTQQGKCCALTRQPLTIEQATLQLRESPPRWVHQDVAKILVMIPEHRLREIWKQIASVDSPICSEERPIVPLLKIPTNQGLKSVPQSSGILAG